MKCKHCQNELQPGMTECPVCGGQNPEAAKSGLGAGKIALLVVLAVAAVAVIAALVMGGGGSNTPVETTGETAGASVPTESIAATDPAETVAATIPADGNPDDVTCKGSYSAEGADLDPDAVVATVGGETLTNAELQIYYWMQVYDFLNQYAYYASAFGLDYSMPLDTQMSIDGELTWQQYFLDSALLTWSNYQAMCLDAQANGYVLDQEYVDYLAELPATLDVSAVEMGFESADAMIQADMGPAASVEGYLEYLNSYYLGYMYYGDTLEKIEVTEAEVEAYYDAYAAEYAANGLEKTDERYVDVRHILISPEGGTTTDGVTTYSDEEWAAAEKQANDILDQWLSGDKTEESFAQLAMEYSVDSGSASNGGLYEDVYEGQMVEPFENWCFDASRTTGDYGIVKTTYGYHIMYFVDSELVWYLTAYEDMMVEKGNEFLLSVQEKYPAEINYAAIKLGVVDLAAAQ